MSGPLLEVRNVIKRFPGVVALDQVSLTLGEAEVLAVIGENGAGKSTLLKLIAGTIRPTFGRVRSTGSTMK